MGVPKLLQFLGPLVSRGNIYTDARCRGKIGVDGHAWLHQLAYEHAEDIVLRKDYGPLAKSFMQQLQTAMGQGAELIPVFDGAPTPAKGITDMARQVRRQKAYTALQYEDRPSPTSLRAAVGLGWPAVEEVIRHLRAAGIPYFVAPYEADAQLAYLAQKGLIFGAQTVDSDFIIHGLPVIYFKVNWRTGRCYIFNREIMMKPEQWPDTNVWRDKPLLPFIRNAGPMSLMCYALSAGCDYDTKQPGIGPMKAIKAMDSVAKNQGWELLSVPGAAIPFLAEAMRILSPTVDKEQWVIKAQKALVVFQHCLAYDPEVKTVVTKSGESCETASRRWPFLGNAIPAGNAEDRALGHISPLGVLANPALPAVASVSCPFIKHRLTEDMVADAQLLPQPWPRGYPTMDRMKAWLRTRHGMPQLSSYNAAEMKAAVRERLSVEHGLRLRGEEILIRDPSGRSLQSYLLEAHPASAWHFPQDSGRNFGPPRNGWYEHQADIAARAPLVEMLLLEKHWEHRLLGDASSRTILDDALGRVQEMTLLRGFAYHPNTDAELPRTRHGGEQKSCFFRMTAPASYRQEPYHVWAECSISNLRNLHPHVTGIIRGSCTCPVGSSAECTHLLMLMFVVMLLPRNEAIYNGTAKPACTSIKCSWINPGENGDVYDVTTPLYDIPFMKSNAKKKKKKRNRKTKKRRNKDTVENVPSVGSYGWRVRFNPVADNDLALLTRRNSHNRRAAREALWAAVAAHLGCDCAAAVTWRNI